MNFKDGLVYLLLGLVLLAFASMYFTIITNKSSFGDRVFVPENEGFYLFEVTNWNAVAKKNSSIIYFEFYSRFMNPLRVKIKDDNGWVIGVKRNNVECKIENVTVTTKNMVVQIENYTQFISGLDRLEIIITTKGEECTGKPGQGYIFDMMFETQQHAGSPRYEIGKIKGFFS